MQTLMMLEPAEVPFADTLLEAVEQIPGGVLVYALSMEADDASKGLLELLLDNGCRVNWILAPKGNFPPILPDEPRIVYGDRSLRRFRGAVKPREVCFANTLEEVLEK